jgi:hypothetical protein
LSGDREIMNTKTISGEICSLNIANIFVLDEQNVLDVGSLGLILSKTRDRGIIHQKKPQGN